jgi:hypothetical protein
MLAWENIFNCKIEDPGKEICQLKYISSNSEQSQNPFELRTCKIKKCYLNLRDQLSQPHKTTGKIIFLYILTITLLDSKLEDKRFCTEW